MILYLHDGDPALGPVTLWQGVTPSGYAIVRGSQTSVHAIEEKGVVSFAGDDIVRIDAGMTLADAHAGLTDGLTKAEILVLGNDLGLALTGTSRKAKLLEAIRSYLEGLS